MPSAGGLALSKDLSTWFYSRLACQAPQPSSSSVLSMDSIILFRALDAGAPGGTRIRDL